jgi:hypothetical protein
MAREEEMGDSKVGLPLSQYIVLGVQVGILGISPILGNISNDRLTHLKALSPLPKEDQMEEAPENLYMQLSPSTSVKC